METQTIQFAFLTGQSVTVKLFADDGTDTVVATPTATESTNRIGVYSFTQTDRPAGTYLLTVSATGINAAYTVQLTLATATFWAHERTHANVTQFGGTGGTFSGGRPEIIVQDGGITAAKLAADAITAAKVSSDVSAEFVTALLTDLLSSSNFNTNGSFGKLVKDYLDAAVSSRSTYAGGDTAGTTTLLNRLSATRAGYLDNLSGGTIATQADVNALNQSASRRIILTTVSQWERPESGSIQYTIEARTYDGDGAAVNADSTPTLTVTGSTTGSLAANLATATNPATGVYRWQYTVSSSATLEQVRADISAVLSGSTFTLTAYAQTTDFVASTWTGADREMLATIFDKLPSRDFLAGANAATGALVTADIGLASANLDTQLTGLNTKLGTPAGASVSADIAAVKTDTGNLVTRIPATLFSGITYLARWLGLIAGKTADSGTLAEMQATTSGAGYDNTTDSLQALRDRGDSGAWGGSGGSGLTGANLVTITVTDGADPVPGAYVRLKAGGDVEVKRTNASGVVTFTTDNNTWTVTIDATNLTFESTTLAVTGDTEITYEMTPVSTSTSAWATGDDLVSYYDAKTIGQMLADDGSAVAAASVPDHAIVTRCLKLASGEVDSALMHCKRYSQADLESLADPSLEHLKHITCAVAVWHLQQRRLGANPERSEALRKQAEAHLERLRKGELVLNLDPQKAAGLIEHVEYTANQITTETPRQLRDIASGSAGVFPKRRTK